METKLNFKQHEGNGVLITFCGLDGSGKTTMINMLSERLKNSGLDIVLTKQPTKAVRESKIFRTYMDEENHDGFDYMALALLTAGDRVQHSNKYILPLLEEGKTVISDRYFYSCLANLRASGYIHDNWIYEIARYIPKPDISVFLDVDVETAISRVRKREAEQNKWIDVPLQYKLRNEYINICKSCGGVLINSGYEEEITFDNVYKYIKPYIKAYKDQTSVHSQNAAAHPQNAADINYTHNPMPQAI